MAKRGEFKRFLPAIVLLILVTFIFLSAPVRFTTGPTGLEIIWVGLNPKIDLAANLERTIDLTHYFASDQELTFIATQADVIRTRVDGSMLTLTPQPGFTGERTITVYAFDGESIMRQRFRIIVTDTILVLEESAAIETAIVDKVERAVEDALAVQQEVAAIVLLKETTPFTFSADAGTQLKQQLLEQRRQQVDAAQDALLERVNDVSNSITGAVVSGLGITMTREYETVNALAVTLTLQGLEQLRTDPAVDRILLDRPFRVFRAQSIPLIDADDVWQITMNNTNISGAGEVVCIIDTGIDLTHPAFAGKILGGYDFYNNDADPQDDNNHGTHVTGIAAGNDSTKGVAPDANIVPVKVCNGAGSCSGSAILAAIDYCNNNSVALNVTVISGSLGDNGQYTSANCPSLFETALNTSVGLGIIPVFASGNNGFTGGVSYPACSPHAISVGSSSKSDTLDTFTNRGDRLDVLAPGNNIRSTVIGGGTAILTGTSMATPHVSGVIALIQHNQRAQGKPRLTLAAMRQLLQETGKQISSWHRVDAYAAMVQLDQNFTINLTENSVTNTTPPKAKITFKESTDFSKFANCSQLKHNFVDIDSVNCPQFNKSAHIVLEGIAGINATPLRNGEPCPADICQNVTLVNGTLEFDVIGFTNYSGNSTFASSALVNGCAVINDSSSLTANISSNETCFIINASNLYLNCSGLSITYGTNNSPNANAIRIDGQDNITVQDCIFLDGNQTGALGAAISMNNVNNSMMMNITLNITGPVPWLEILGTSTANNASTLTFANSNGRLLYAELVNITTITQTLLNITPNRIFLNSTNLSFLNTSAQISLFGITFIDPKPITDLDDDGTFADCPASICQEESFSAGTFIYNVTQFSTHGANETTVFNVSNLYITKTDAPDPVENDTQLNYTILVQSTGNGTASNVTLTEVYPSQVIFNSAQPSPSSGNDTFVLGNLTPGTNLTLNITLNVTQVANQTVLSNTANASFQNETSQVLVNRTATSSTTTTNFSGIQPAPPPQNQPPPPPPSSSGSAGGGGGDSKPKKKDDTAQPSQPAAPAQLPTSPRAQTLQTTRNPQRQSTQAAPEEAAAAEQPLLVSTATDITEQENAIRAAKHKKIFAYAAYGVSFAVLVALSVYWFMLHHRKPATPQ